MCSEEVRSFWVDGVNWAKRFKDRVELGRLGWGRRRYT